MSTTWNDDWSAGFDHPLIGGMKGMTDAVVVSRHDPMYRRDVWNVGIACGPEVCRLIGIDKASCSAVMDDFGNLVSIDD